MWLVDETKINTKLFAYFMNQLTHFYASNYHVTYQYLFPERAALVC